MSRNKLFMVARTVSMDRRLLYAACTVAMNPRPGRESKPLMLCFNQRPTGYHCGVRLVPTRVCTPNEFVLLQEDNQVPFRRGHGSNCFPKEAKLVFRPTQEEGFASRPSLTSSREEDGGRLCSGIEKKLEHSHSLDHQLCMP